jgi:F-type H+-transporting ATPase subunit gamma
MATVQELNRRIKSIKNTRKITRAMEMVSAAKLRKAQQRIEILRPFAQSLVELTALVSKGAEGSVTHPLLTSRDDNTICIIMFTGDRGLAGALNANVLRQSLVLRKRWESEGKTVRFIAVGKKGAASLQFRNIELDAAFRGITDEPKFRDAESIARRVTDSFASTDYDRVVLVYNNFINAAAQKIIVQDLLPLSDEAVLAAVGKAAGDTSESASSAAESASSGPSADWIYEPSTEALIDRLIPTYVEQTVFRALLESTASEHGARMTAMHSATKNAGELMDGYTLQRNRARQAAITQEILEVVAGADAL